MNLFEQLLSALTVAVCAVLLVRLCLGRARQQRVDHAARAIGGRLRDGVTRLWRWPGSRRAAEREAQAIIERARAAGRPKGPDDGEWTGNVYTPKSFRKTRRPDKLH